MTKAHIDNLLTLIRSRLSLIDTLDGEIAERVAARNVEKQAKAELEGRIAYIEGRKKGRNPYPSPLLRSWNIGYDAERVEGMVLPDTGE